MRAWFLVGVAACSYTRPADVESTGDDQPHDDARIFHDAAGHIDAPASLGACTIAADLGSLSPTQQQAIVQTQQQDILMIGSVGGDHLIVELFGGRGEFPGFPVDGIYQLSGLDADHCGICVLYEQSPGSATSNMFLATDGVINLDKVPTTGGGLLQATLGNLDLVRVATDDHDVPTATFDASCHTSVDVVSINVPSIVE